MNCESVLIVEYAASDSRQKLEVFAAAAQANASGTRTLLPVSSSSLARRTGELLSSLGVSFSSGPWSAFRDKLRTPHEQASSSVACESLRELGRRIGGLDISGDAFAMDRERVQGRSVIVSLSEEEDDLPWGLGLVSGRPVLQAKDTVNIFRQLRSAASILIVPTDTFSVESLRALLATKRAAQCSAPLGFLYPFGTEAREFFALKSFVFSRFKKTRLGKFLFSFPLERKNEVFSTEQSTFLIGPGSSLNALGNKQATLHEFFFTTAHSNGVDLGLGSMVLCGRGGHEPQRRFVESMPCFSGAQCSRKTPSNTIVGPSDLKTAIAFLYTCWGVLLHGATYHPETSLAHQFALSPHTGCLLTTYTMSLLDRAAGPYLAELYNAGLPLGEAVERLNQRHFLRYQDESDVVILFGDPATSIVPGSRLIDQAPDSREQRFFNWAFVEPYEDAEESSLRLGASAPDVGRSESADRSASLGGRHAGAIEYARMVAAATRALGREPLEKPIAKLGAAADRLGLETMLLESRSHQRGILEMSEARVRSHVNSTIESLHTAWVEYYESLAGTMGGYVRLQVDKYFASHPTDPSRAYASCDYCGGVVRRSTRTSCGPIPVTRRLLECYNCATIFDGMDSFACGTLVTRREWALGEKGQLEVNFELERPTSGPMTVAAILEPYLKPSAAKAVVESRYLDTESHCAISLSALALPDGSAAGAYYLNVLVLVAGETLFLRRPLYFVKEIRKSCQ